MLICLRFLPPSSSSSLPYTKQVGAWIRYVGELDALKDYRLELQFGGQILAAIAQPVIISCPTLMAATWFGDDERALANTIASLANPIGLASQSHIRVIKIAPTTGFEMCFAIGSRHRWVLRVQPKHVSNPVYNGGLAGINCGLLMSYRFFRPLVQLYRRFCLMAKRGCHCSC